MEKVVGALLQELVAQLETEIDYLKVNDSRERIEEKDVLHRPYHKWTNLKGLMELASRTQLTAGVLLGVHDES